MSRTTENDCVSCANGCIQCGRKDDYVLVRCDWCDDTIREEDFEDEDWHQIQVHGELDQSRIETLVMCESCHSDMVEAIQNFKESYDTFQGELRDLVVSLMGKFAAENTFALMDKCLEEITDKLG